MNRNRRGSLLAACLLLIGMASQSQAQFAVIDVASIAKLVQQLTTMTQQLATLRNQLRQAQLQYQSLTGNRGMQGLLAGINRNYLPTDWAALVAAMNGGGPNVALAAGIQNNIQGNALLTQAQIGALSASEQAQLRADRQTVALLQAIAQEALATTSTRFNSLQQLIGAIGTATDAKGALDLQARIAAEQSMLANDQSKLQVLYQAAQAQEWAQQQRAREEAIADIGSLRALPPMGL